MKEHRIRWLGRLQRMNDKSIIPLYTKKKERYWPSKEDGAWNGNTKVCYALK